MSKVTIKYKHGSKVKINHGLIEGIVTAIFIRGKGRSYEVSYTGDSGPTNVVCEEVELESCERVKFGFERKDS